MDSGTTTTTLHHMSKAHIRSSANNIPSHASCESLVPVLALLDYAWLTRWRRCWNLALGSLHCLRRTHSLEERGTKTHIPAFPAIFLHTTTTSRGIRSPTGPSSSPRARKSKATSRTLQKGTVSEVILVNYWGVKLLIRDRKQKVHAAEQQDHRSQLEQRGGLLESHHRKPKDTIHAKRLGTRLCKRHGNFEQLEVA